MEPAPHDIQLMSKHRILGFKPQLRLEWRGQDGQSETEQPDHSASLGDSITASTRIRFSVHTGPLAEAIRYALARWPALTRFLDDGRIELDNNPVERAIRPVALGRKNHLFAGSDERASYCPSGYLLINQALPGTDCETPDDGIGDSLPLSVCLPAGDRRFSPPKALPYRVVQPTEAQC
jgi:hypothetical protein